MEGTEIIGGLKKQGFLIAQGKNIVPTEAGLSLFGVLKQADPALVDPGVTAQLECLLDEVVIGKQEMVGAIDAVCDVAQRIIGKLKEGGAGGGPSVLSFALNCAAAARPSTPAMKRFVDSVARQKGIEASSRLHEIRIHLPRISGPTRAQESPLCPAWRAWLQIGKPGAAVVG